MGIKRVNYGNRWQPDIKPLLRLSSSLFKPSFFSHAARDCGPADKINYPVSHPQNITPKNQTKALAVISSKVGIGVFESATRTGDAR